MKATGYILKPIQLKEVTSVLKKARDTIEMEFQREQVIQRLTSQLSENMSALCERQNGQSILSFHQNEDYGYFRRFGL
ncbi:hypothetical protein P5G65_15625 [Paenibacillus chondroitinus]|uniref:Response regulatory domain-containing protein n=1 Tax=Paenibacillus chondroitinus TaxID=59842 RepID=A0ABU6DD75_9BACL|nr:MULTISPECIES: hypothetical protein [Paenibacillus]MCY9656511.1 hypothetical protein [Paenibacillus anseongense]MEB4795335.1 hypothetical protein [Paenibacillus chondroitinus]